MSSLIINPERPSKIIFRTFMFDKIQRLYMMKTMAHNGNWSKTNQLRDEVFKSTQDWGKIDSGVVSAKSCYLLEVSEIFQYVLTQIKKTYQNHSLIFTPLNWQNFTKNSCALWKSLVNLWFPELFIHETHRNTRTLSSSTSRFELKTTASEKRRRESPRWTAKTNFSGDGYCKIHWTPI